MANSRAIRRRLTLNAESLESRHMLTELTGLVFEDINNNGIRDVGEPGVGGITVYVDADQDRRLDDFGYGLDPDEAAADQRLDHISPQIRVTRTGPDNQPAGEVRAVNTEEAITGDRVFGNLSTHRWTSAERLRFDLSESASAASIDLMSTGSGKASIRMDAFNASHQRVAQASTRMLNVYVRERLQVQRDQADISYVIVYVAEGIGSATYDNFRVNGADGERSTTTRHDGYYRMSGLPAGPATVRIREPRDYQQTSPAEGAAREVELVNNTASYANFGVQTASIEGVAFQDLGAPGSYNPDVDVAVQGVAFYLDENMNGQPDPRDVVIDPDVYQPQQTLNHIQPLVELQVAAADNQPTGAAVTAAADSVVSADGQLFAHPAGTAWNSARRLRANFQSPANHARIDFTAADDTVAERGILIAYSATGEPLDSDTTRLLQHGESQTLSITREQFDIAYVVAYTSTESAQGRLDNLRATMVRERVAISDAEGVYRFKPLDEGSYVIAALGRAGHDVAFPNSALYATTVDLGQREDQHDFGFRLTNQPPLARPDVANTSEDTSVGIGVLVNDSDPEGQLSPVTVTITQPPANGQALVTPDGQIIYTPNADFHGRDSLLYTVRDEQGTESNTATVTILIAPTNDAPVAVDDTVRFTDTQPIPIGVLANDHDVDDGLNPNSLTIHTVPNGGQVTVDGDTGVIYYHPSSLAPDVFQYTVEDTTGMTSNIATVTLQPVTDRTPPTAVNDLARTAEGTAINIDLADNDTATDASLALSSLLITARPQHGQVSIAENGTVRYRPNLAYVGEDQFEYVIRDDAGLVSNVASVTITMTARTTPYLNPIRALDVNADGTIAPQDALFIINEINHRSISSPLGQITSIPPTGTRPAGYFDVDGDGFIVPKDVLLLISHLNAANAAEAEPPAEPAAANAAAAARAFATWEATSDQADDEEE